VLISKAKLTSLISLFALCSCFVSYGRSEAPPSDVRVELKSQNPPLVRVTIWSRAKNTVTFPRFRLPWGNRYSLILVAVTPQGEYLDRVFPVDDPSPERVTFQPNESMSGEIDLRNFFGHLDSTLNKSDVHLFWAYKPPKELGIADWSGGWILIPQQP